LGSFTLIHSERKGSGYFTAKTRQSNAPALPASGGTVLRHRAGPAGERLAQGGARSRDQANRYLEQVYLPLWNRRFSCEAEQAGDAHRALDRRLELDSVLSQGSHLTLGNRPRKMRVNTS